MDRLSLDANGLRFAARTWGQGPNILLLHGFPDDADSFAPVGERLAKAGFRAVAPFMRGYAPTAVPPGSITSLETLADDVAGLVQALGGVVGVVGHDWGAAAAWAAGIKHPAVVRRVLGLSVPPLDALLRGLTPAQVRRSAYMLAFQVPGIEAWVRARNFALISRLWRDWSPDWTPPPGRLEAVKRTLASPGTLHAALGYYRGLLRSPALLHFVRPLGCPARVLVGARDGCMAPEAFRRVPGVVVVPQAGHFLPLEAPDHVVQHAKELISTH